MGTIKEGLRVALNLIGAMNFTDFLDIAIVAFVIYKLVTFARKTSVSGLFKGIFILIGVLLLAGALNLTMVESLLRKVFELGVIALIILFQPEIRKFLTTTGSSINSVFELHKETQPVETAVRHTVDACVEMSKTKTGALIVFQRNVHLNEYVKSGTAMDSIPSVELLLQVFYPNTPLHDGAVIVADGKIVAAGCMLPMSANMNLSRELGMRHRAGIGISERSDAVAVIVSEETGAISVAVDGMLKRHLSPETFEMLLKNELIPEKVSMKDRILGKLRKSNV